MVRTEAQTFTRSKVGRGRSLINKANELCMTVPGSKVYVAVLALDGEVWEYDNSDWEGEEAGECQVITVTRENFDTVFPALDKNSARKRVGLPLPPELPSTASLAATSLSTPPSTSPMPSSSHRSVATPAKSAPDNREKTPVDDSTESVVRGALSTPPRSRTQSQTKAAAPGGSSAGTGRLGLQIVNAPAGGSSPQPACQPSPVPPPKPQETGVSASATGEADGAESVATPDPSKKKKRKVSELSAEEFAQYRAKKRARRERRDKKELKERERAGLKT